jgi:carbamoyltransferase
MDILGISSYYHDSAACLVRDGVIVAAAQEERFTRKKHDASFPAQAIASCLRQGNTHLAAVDHIVFYDKPLAKFDRILETYLTVAPRGLASFVTAMPLWLKEKLFLGQLLQKELRAIGAPKRVEILFTEHHEAHAASAFYPSPWQEAAILCMDGVGEWATTSAWMGQDDHLVPLWEIHFPHSLGLLYSACTFVAGFRVNSGEYKLMGLAPYGQPTYVQRIYEHLIDVKPDGTFRLNMDYFAFCTGLRMTNDRFHALVDGPPRTPESPLTKREVDLACSIQVVTNDIVVKLATTLYQETGAKQLCLAGGVALNCVANAQVLKDTPFEGLWIQPAAGDAGGAVGAALTIWHGTLGNTRRANGHTDGMHGALLGPSFSNDEVKTYLLDHAIPYEELDDANLFSAVAHVLAEGNVVGWFQGRMEFGPRALGNRSILGDARNPQMRATMNQKIKQRETFRPFAPSVLWEAARDYFDLSVKSPYMLLVASVREHYRTPRVTQELNALDVPSSEIPAVTHVDYSARVQTVDEQPNPRYYALLRAFKRLTGCALLANTSFNVRGEPIVCTPHDAYECFLHTDMDFLVLENCLLDKRQQPARTTTRSFALD